MITIPITKDFTLRSEIHCWVVLKNGMPKWFYSTLHDVLIDLINNELLKKKDLKTMIELLNHIKSVEKNVLQTINAIPGLK